MLKYIHIILICLTFSACYDDNLFKKETIITETVDGKTIVSLNLTPAGFITPSKSRSILKDTDIKTAWAVVFENPATDSYNADAIVREIADITLSNNGESGQIALTPSTRPTFMLLIANTSFKIADQITPGMSYREVINDVLSYGDPKRNGEGKIQSGLSMDLLFTNYNSTNLITPIPMSGVSQILPTIGKGTKLDSAIIMHRLVNKFYINATIANNKNGFVLHGISLANIPVSTPFDLKGTLGVKPEQQTEKVTLYRFSNHTSSRKCILQDITDNSTKSGNIDRPLYFYESYMPFDVILCGTLPGIPSERYYKVRINTKTSGNSSILLNVLSIQSIGHNSFEEALKAAPASSITFDIDIIDNSQEGILNERYYLGLSNSEFHLYADGAQKNITVATINTNAFNMGAIPPTTRVELIAGENLTLITNNISSNSTDIKVDFHNTETATGTIRVTIDKLTRDIVIKKALPVIGNYSSGSEGIMIANDIISAHVVDNNPRVGLSTTQSSNDRHLNLHSEQAMPCYFFIQNTVDEDLVEIKALASNGRSILVRNITNFPEFAGNNIYWDPINNRPKFDNINTAQRNNTENIQGIVTAHFGSLVLYMSDDSNRYNIVKSMRTNSKDLNDHYKSGISDVEFNLNGQKIPLKPNEDIGDICEFMTRRGWTPLNNKGNTKWRLPNFHDLMKYGLFNQRHFKRVGSFSNMQNPKLSSNGTSLIPSYELLFGIFKLPASGSTIFSNPISAINRSGNIICATYGREGNYGIDVFTCSYGLYYSSEDRYFQMRCIRDDSAEEVIPLHKITYNIKGGSVPEELTLNKYVDHNTEFYLSNTKINNSGNNTHTGWIIDGKTYSFGEKIQSVTSDLIIEPKWN